jgi:hypothetical protein
VRLSANKAGRRIKSYDWLAPRTRAPSSAVCFGLGVPPIDGVLVCSAADYSTRGSHPWL